jgi:PEP-CTERM motif
MKKVLLALGLAVLSLASAYANGTINPINTVLSRVVLDADRDGIVDRFITQDDGIRVQLFYGAADTIPDIILGEMTIGTTSGVLFGLPSILEIPGYETGQVFSLQARGQNEHGWHGETEIIQATAGPAAGLGTVIWQSSIGRDPSRFHPLVIVPEPSTLALGGLACAFLLLRARKTLVRR